MSLGGRAGVPRKGEGLAWNTFHGDGKKNIPVDLQIKMYKIIPFKKKTTYKKNR